MKPRLKLFQKLFLASFFSCLFLLVFGSSCQAATYIVAQDGSGNFTTINEGIAVLQDSDILRVKAGTYAENLYSFPSGTSWDKPVTIQAFSDTKPIIKPNSGGFVLRFIDTQYVIIDGLVLDGSNIDHDVIKITNSSSEPYAHHIRIKNCEVINAGGGQITTEPKSQGILVGGHHNEFINLDVHHNGTSDFDHGIYISGDDNLIENCSIHHNAGWGVHIYNGHSGEFADHNIVRNNKVYNNAQVGPRGVGIGLYTGTENAAYNNLAWGNNYGIAINYDALNTKVFNNTVYENDNHGIYIGPESNNAIIQNNISYYNGSSGIRDNGTGTTLSHNLTDQDPRFLNADGKDFHLQPDSPAIDTGTTISEVTHDFEGNSRPQGAGYDIGAYEYTTGVSPSSTPTPSPTPPLPLCFSNNTGIIDSDDVTAWATSYLQNNGVPDINSDNKINSFEFGYLVANWDEDCQ